MTTKVLAFDTALNGCAVALWDSATGQASTRLFETGREQAAKLVPLIQETLEEAGVAFADVGLIVTTVGPGSFTGLRIGLSTARSLSMALNIPVQGITTFEAMAVTCKPVSPFLVVLESKRQDYYVQSFDVDGDVANEPACLLAADIIKHREALFCGDALARLEQEVDLSGKSAIPRRMIDPVALARKGWQVFEKNGQQAKKPAPLYLRGADVSMSNKAARKIKNFPPL